MDKNIDKNIEKLSTEIAELLANKKAQDVICIDISSKTILADTFVIASGRSAVQVKALCDEVEDYCKENEIEIKPKEGYSAARWVIMDLKDVVIHIFRTEDREFYNLERLWVDEDNVREFA